MAKSIHHLNVFHFKFPNLKAHQQQQKTRANLIIQHLNRNHPSIDNVLARPQILGAADNLLLQHEKRRIQNVFPIA